MKEKEREAREALDKVCVAKKLRPSVNSFMLGNYVPRFKCPSLYVFVRNIRACMCKWLHLQYRTASKH